MSLLRFNHSERVFCARLGAYEEKGEGWAAKARSVTLEPPRYYRKTSIKIPLDQIREVIEQRIATYPSGSIHFNLLAIRGDPLPDLQKQLQVATESGELGSVELLSEQIHMEESKRAEWAVCPAQHRISLSKY